MMRSGSLSPTNEFPALTDMYITRSRCEVGSRVVPSRELELPGWCADEITDKTGVASRFWVDDEQDVVSLAKSAAAEAVELVPPFMPVAAAICCTASQCELTPSIACRVATSLDRLSEDDSWFAMDINAACSGFLFGLQMAFDQLRHRPDAAVLLLTSEVISRNIDPTDPVTRFIFGDAATATIVTTRPIHEQSLAFQRPTLRSVQDKDNSLYGRVGQYLQMRGISMARQAVKQMSSLVAATLADAEQPLAEVECVLAHPGSKRIVSGVANRLGIDESRILHTLAETGNTSSSSIPLTIARRWEEIPEGKPLAMVAFGSGFTVGATSGQKLVEVPEVAHSSL